MAESGKKPTKATPAKNAKPAPAQSAKAANGDAKSAKKGGKGKVIVLAVVALVILGGGAGAGLYFTGIIGGKSQPAPKQNAVIDLGPPVYVDMPEKTVDLKVAECKSPYLRFQMTIEVPQKSQPAVAAKQIQIMDAVQQALRSFERQEVTGVEGSDRVRNASRRVIDEIIAPEKINGVLFKKFIVQ